MQITASAAIMTDALARFDRAGQKLVSAVSGGDEDAPAAIGDMIEAKTQFQAGATMVKLGDEMMRALLDIVANDR